MKRLKTFLIYALILIGFWLLSNLLIEVGINSMYKPIESINDLKQQGIEIYQAEATLVNGRILGTVRNSQDGNISNKFLKLQLFSERNNEIGTRYIDIGEATNGTAPVDIHFKIDNVRYYSLEVVNERGEDTGANISLLPADLTTGKIFMGVLIILILW